MKIRGIGASLIYLAEGKSLFLLKKKMHVKQSMATTQIRGYRGEVIIGGDTTRNAWERCTHLHCTEL